MKLNCAAFLALASSTTTIEAFLYPNFAGPKIRSSATVQMVGGWDNDDFLAALSGGNPQAGNQPPKVEGADEAAEDQGGSMFKRILEQAKSRVEPGPRPVMNPFLAVPNDPVSPVNNPLELSVEEQARMFREMMKNGGVPAGPMELPAVRRIAKTDRAGKPVGRNRDADTIANTADLYFAQLKRDSSVRGIARIQGDDELANKVFEDEGIKELETILVKNPYLKGLREKEQALIDTVPEELIKPFFDPDTLPEEERNTSGISYKEVLKQKRQNQQGGAALPASSTQATNYAETVATQPPQNYEQVVPQPPQNYQQTRTVPPQSFIPQPAAPVAPVVPPRPPQTQIQQTPPPPPSAVVSSSTSDPEDAKRKIRTFMGMLLKHRGGPGFGKGRLKGAEIEQFNNLLDKVTAMLRAEAAQSAVATDYTPPTTIQQRIPPPIATPVVTTPVVTPAVIAVNNPPSQQLDSMIACIEGAVLMYKNSPMELKSAVMVTLRAALAAAVTTCDSVIGSDPSPIPAAASQVDATIAVIEGAVSMYKHSPPELRSSVLITLRAALKIAVITCDSLLGTPSTVPPFPTAPATPVAPAPIMQSSVQAAVSVPTQVVSQPAAPAVPATDRNSKALNEIYQKVSNAAGDGRLGLRSDLTSQEASELADGLMDMRAILMEELDAGIPDPEPESAQPTTDGTMSTYQQMLAKARAEKAGNS